MRVSVRYVRSPAASYRAKYKPDEFHGDTYLTVESVAQWIAVLVQMNWGERKKVAESRERPTERTVRLAWGINCMGARMRGQEESKKRLRNCSTALGIRWQRTQGNLNDWSAFSLSLSLSAACRMRRALNYTWVQLKTRTIPQGVKGMNDTLWVCLCSLFLSLSEAQKRQKTHIERWLSGRKRKRRKQHIWLERRDGYSYLMVRSKHCSQQVH